MAPTYEIRTYTLKSAEIAKEYSTHWEPHISSLAKFNITTHAVFRSLTNPKQVIALLQYRDGDDPKAIAGQYMQSQEFKKDMEGFDMSSFESVVSNTLEALSFSPLK